MIELKGGALRYRYFCQSWPALVIERDKLEAGLKTLEKSEEESAESVQQTEGTWRSLLFPSPENRSMCRIHQYSQQYPSATMLSTTYTCFYV